MHSACCIGCLDHGLQEKENGFMNSSKRVNTMR